MLDNLDFEYIVEDHINDFNEAMVCIEKSWDMKSGVIRSTNKCITKFDETRSNKWK